jgi:hypothetical protein
MNDNFLYREDPQAMKIVLDTIKDHDAASSLVRVALSLGAVIAGGAAISLFASRMNSEGAIPHARRWANWRDIDLWFPNETSLNTFIATAAIDPAGIKCTKSYGGHAIDIRCVKGGPLIQVITFRKGSPVEIISHFDFINCAVAFDGKGFWYHKEVPELTKQKKLALQCDNSPYFLSRVNKYASKGYLALDESVSKKLFVELCDALDAANALADVAVRDLEAGVNSDLKKSEYDEIYQPIVNKLHQASTVARKFINLSVYSDKVLTPDQVHAIQLRYTACDNLLTRMGAERRKRVKLPYGYINSHSETL